MKIHTTQNLGSQLANNPTNSTFAQNELSMPRLQNERLYSKALLMDNIFLEPSFKGKKPNSKQVKKFIESIKKAVGNVADKAKPEAKTGDNLLRSPLFNKLLNVVDYETVVQASIAAVACTARAGTILAMSNDKNRENNTYAVSHALASGIVGFITVFLLTAPFKAGTDHVMKKMFSNLKENVLKRLHPQLDEKSIIDKAGKRIPMKTTKIIDGKKVEQINWKDIYGNEFCTEIKNCDMLPQFKHISEVSKETFEKVLGIKNIDWATQKGKSFNDVVTKDGKKLYDIIDFSKLGFKVSHSEISAKSGKEITSKGQILFSDIDKSYLQELISTADNTSIWKNLDINSAFNKNGITDIKNWKSLDGKKWKLDLDSVFVSSPLETFDYAPRITGAMRYDNAEGIHKFRTYQRNGKNGKLGTAISDEMLRADKESAGLIKSLTWLPDLVFRIPIALTTVSLIPWILKNLFHVEKKKPQEIKSQEENNSVLKVLLKEHKQVENTLNNIMKAIEQGIINNTTNKRMKDLENELAELDRQILIEKSKSAFKMSKQDLKEFYIEALRLEPKLLIDYVIQEIKVFEDRIEITFNSPIRKSPDDKNQGFFIFSYISKLPQYIQNKELPNMLNIEICVYI